MLVIKFGLTKISDESDEGEERTFILVKMTKCLGNWRRRWDTKNSLKY